MTPKGKKILIASVVVVALSITAFFLYKRKKKKDDLILENEKPKEETTKASNYDIAKKLFPEGKEIKDSFVVQKTTDFPAMTFWKNGRMMLIKPSDNKKYMGSYEDGGKTKPTLKLKLDNGTTLFYPTTNL